MKPWQYIEVGLAILFVVSYVRLWRKYVRAAVGRRETAKAWASASARAGRALDSADAWQAEVDRLRVLEDGLRTYGWNGEPIHEWLMLRLYRLPGGPNGEISSPLVQVQVQCCGGTGLVTTDLTMKTPGFPDTGGQATSKCPGCPDCT